MLPPKNTLVSCLLKGFPGSTPLLTWPGPNCHRDAWFQFGPWAAGVPHQPVR